MISNGKVGIIIQARMGSTRLPSKIMLNIQGKAVFKYQLERLSSLIYPVYIATTINPNDKTIVDFATANNLQYFRGSEDNVLERFFECAKLFKIETIVRITSDCPLIDTDIINQGITEYLEAGNPQLFLSNTLERTFPRGSDFEIFSFDQLKFAFENATEGWDTEHVTPFIWENKSGTTIIRQFKQDKDYSAYRLTLDTPEDMELISILIEKYQAHTLSMDQICDIMENNPSLSLINGHIEQKKA